MNGFPRPLGAFRVWQRHLDVFRTYFQASIVGNIGEPLLMLFGIGLGLGAFVKEVEGLSYLEFLAPGVMAASAMTSAAFECIYGSYTRLTQQKVFDGMVATPLMVEDVVAGEILWGASKSVLSAGIMLAVLAAVGLFHQYHLAPLILLNMFALGMAFAGFALCVSAVSRSYEFFNFFFTLVITPLILFSGVYFPTDRMPGWMADFFLIFPTPHAVNINHYLFHGSRPEEALTGVVYLLVMAPMVGWLAAKLVKRRMVPPH